MDLQQERDHGQHRPQHGQRPEVGPVRYGDRLPAQRRVGRHAQRQEDHASGELPQQHRGAVLPRTLPRLDVQDGEDRIDGRRGQSPEDAGPVAHVQAENQQDTRDRDKADQQLRPLDAPPRQQRLEERGEEAGSRDAGHPHRHVRSLDALVESHPVQRQQDAERSEAQHGTARAAVQPARQGQHREQGRQGDQDAVPHQRQPVQADHPAEDAGPPRQEHGEVQQKQGAGLRVHSGRQS